VIIEISADAVVWYIAVLLSVLSVLLFFTLMAIRVLTGVLYTELQALKKKIPSLGGGGAGGDGGMGGILNIFGGLFGGGK